MKTEDLKAHGLNDEQVTFVMAENGKDIKREKDKADSYKIQLDTAKESLKAFEGVDVAEMKNKITTLTKDLAAKETEYQTKLADMEFNHSLDSAITASGARNLKAVKALLDIDTLKASKNRDIDIKNAISAVKTDNDYMFTSNEPIMNPVAGTSGSTGKKMSLEDAMKYANAHPDIDVNTLV